MPDMVIVAAELHNPPPVAPAVAAVGLGYPGAFGAICVGVLRSCRSQAMLPRRPRRWGRISPAVDCGGRARRHVDPWRRDSYLGTVAGVILITLLLYGPAPPSR